MSSAGGEQPWWADRGHYWKRTLLGASLTFALLATVFYVLRVYASRVARRRLRTDDVFMGLAVLFMWAETGSVLLKCYNGVGVPKTALSHQQQFRLNLGSWLVAKFCVLSMVFVRLSIIFFFRVVFGVYDNIRRILNFLAVFNVVWGIVCFCVAVWSCKPVSFYWDKSIQGGWCVDTKIYNNESLAFSVLGLVMDLAILITPMSRIWQMQIRVQHKRAITAILGIGVIVCVFSLLRCVQFAYFDTAHLSTSGNLETTWTFLENDISIICGCMPQLRPLLPKFLDDDSHKEPTSFYHGSINFLKWRRKSTAAAPTAMATPAGYTANTNEGRHSSEMELNTIISEPKPTSTRDARDNSPTRV